MFSAQTRRCCIKININRDTFKLKTIICDDLCEKAHRNIVPVCFLTNKKPLNASEHIEGQGKKEGI